MLALNCTWLHVGLSLKLTASLWLKSRGMLCTHWCEEKGCRQLSTSSSHRLHNLLIASPRPCLQQLEPQIFLPVSRSRRCANINAHNSRTAAGNGVRAPYKSGFNDDNIGGPWGQRLGVPTTCPGRWSSLWIPAGHLEAGTTRSPPHWSRYGWGPTLPWPGLEGEQHNNTVSESIIIDWPSLRLWKTKQSAGEKLPEPLHVAPQHLVTRT